MSTILNSPASPVLRFQERGGVVGDVFERKWGRCHSFMSKVSWWEDGEAARASETLTLCSRMSLEGHLGTFDVPRATRNNDLRRFDHTGARWAMLENKDLRRRQFSQERNVPENVPSPRGHAKMRNPVAAMLRRPTKRRCPRPATRGVALA
jgi:hypothetical protein